MIPSYTLYQCTKPSIGLEINTQILLINTEPAYCDLVYTSNGVNIHPKDIDTLLEDLSIKIVASRGSGTALRIAHPTLIEHMLTYINRPDRGLTQNDISSLCFEFGDEFLLTLLQATANSLNSVYTYMGHLKTIPIIRGKIWEDLKSSIDIEGQAELLNGLSYYKLEEEEEVSIRIYDYVLTLEFASATNGCAVFNAVNLAPN